LYSDDVASYTSTTGEAAYVMENANYNVFRKAKERAFMRLDKIQLKKSRTIELPDSRTSTLYTIYTII
jgi:hypothetical protein